MATIYKYMSVIKELVASNRLTMIDNNIVFDGRKRNVSKLMLVQLSISKEHIIYPNCFMVAYIFQTGMDIPNGHKVAPVDGINLALENLKVVKINSYRGPPPNKNMSKLSVEITARIRKEYRERFIVPCSFLILRNRYKICNAQIVNILYNTSQESFWLQVAAIEPPLNREDSKQFIPGDRLKSLPAETRKKNK
jgi:hypothetical protein